MNAPTRTGPSIKRGQSKQDHETPKDFIEAIEKRFGRIEWDLAANEQNKKATCYFGPDHKNPDCRDGLAQDWDELVGGGGVFWLNLEFGFIDPWAEKCASARGRCGFTLLLTPASIGTDWFREHVENKAVVLGLSPRIKFVGETQGYPKDLMLSVFGFGLSGFGTWRWKP